MEKPSKGAIWFPIEKKLLPITSLNYKTRKVEIGTDNGVHIEMDMDDDLTFLPIETTRKQALEIFQGISEIVETITGGCAMESTHRERIRKMLNRWGTAINFCKEKQKEINDIRDIIDTIRDLKGQSLGETRTKQKSDPTYKRAMKAIDETKKYEHEIANLQAQISDRLSEKATVDRAVNMLEPHKSNIISLYYKNMKPGRSWDVVSLQSGYTEDACKKLEAQAVDEIIENLLKVDTK